MPNLRVVSEPTVPKMSGPIPKHPREAERLAALAELALAPTPRLQELIEQVADALRAPMAILNVVHADEQDFLCRQGTDTTGTDSLVGAICPWVVATNRDLEIPDTRLDDRFSAAADGPFRLRSYYGVPVRTSDGLPFGALCVIDHQVRTFDPVHKERMASLARAVEDHVARRHLERQLQRAQRESRERLVDLMTLVADRGAVHQAVERDARQLLQALACTDDALHDAEVEPALHDELTELTAEAEACAARILDTARSAEAGLRPRRREVGGEELLRRVQEALWADAHRYGVDVRTDARSSKPLHIDIGLARQALAMVARRVVHHLDQQQRLHLLLHAEAGGWIVELRWASDQPAVALDPSTEAFCREVMRTHGGRLEWGVTDGTHTCARFAFPYASRARRAS